MLRKVSLYPTACIHTAPRPRQCRASHSCIAASEASIVADLLLLWSANMAMASDAVFRGVAPGCSVARESNSFLERIMMNSQGWLLRALGAYRATSKAFSTRSSGTSSSLKRLMLLRSSRGSMQALKSFKEKHTMHKIVWQR